MQSQVTDVVFVFPMVELVQVHASLRIDGPWHTIGPIRDDLTNSLGRQQLQAWLQVLLLLILVKHDEQELVLVVMNSVREVLGFVQVQESE